MRILSRKAVVRRAFLIGAAGITALTTAQVGCSSTHGDGTPVGTPAEPVTPEATGAVGMNLTLPGGTVVNSVHYVITGPGGSGKTVQSGDVNVSGSAQLMFQVSGLPNGSYTVTLTATSVDGNSNCSGSAMFVVTPRATTNIAVQLQCTTKAPEAGSALVTASEYSCATWTGVMVSPAETTVGNSVAVTGTAVGPNPGGLTYQWSAPSGSFDAPGSPAAHFTCSAPGPVTLTLSVSDGPVPDGGSCDPSLATATVQVQCDGHLDQAAKLATATKIKHLVVVFGENISFDHYFGTYPVAQNNGGEKPFVAAVGTPAVNGLTAPLDPTSGFAPVTGVDLINANPNFTNAANNNDAGVGASNPFRMGPSQAGTNDQGHNYKPEQQASDNGAMDLFPKFTGTAGPPPGSPAGALSKGLVMGYFDGNTVSALWGWAQSYAMNDNSWTTVFGPSTPGAINLISGQTNGFAATNKTPSTMSANHVVADGNGGWTLIGDTDPLGDVCSTASDQNSFLGKNVGDLLNAKGVSWGWFEGGFDLTINNVAADGGVTTGCSRATAQTIANPAGISVDYIPHHQPFQYYASTANLSHARPSSIAAIGNSVETDGVTPEPANHQYDSHDFFDALAAGNLPAVVYVKAPAFQDGHPGYSNPIDEQNFLTSVVSALQASQEWSTTAIVLAYDDSDGWYDHQAPPIVNPSSSAADALNGAGICNSGAQQNGAAPTTPLLGAVPAEGGPAVPVQGRCGYGTRMPLLVISPYAKKNYVDHTLTDQSSILKFVEDNWLGGQRIQAGGSFDTIAGTMQNMLSGI